MLKMKTFHKEVQEEGDEVEIKEDEENLDVMLVGNAQQGVDAFDEALGVLLPKHVVQKDAHDIHAQGLRPPQFQVNFLRIKSVLLPHFQFIDGIGGDVVTADEPGLFGVPVIGGFR